MATIGSAKATLVNKIDSLTSSATAKDTIFLAKALKENSSLNNFVWKGVWTATTEYVTDDVVSNGGNTYMCIAAHTSGASFATGSNWSIMASAGTAGTDGTNGTNGTDVGTGTAGQVLKTNSAGTAIEWGDSAAGGKVLQVVNTQIGSSKTRLGSSSTSFVERVGFSTQITPTSATSDILITVSVGWSNNSQSDRWFATLYRNGVNVTDNYGIAVKQNSASGKVSETMTVQYLDSPNTTSPCTYTLHFRSQSSVAFESPGEVSSASESIILMEIGA